MLIVESGDKPAGMVDQEGVETAALTQEIYNEDDKAQVQVKDLKIPVVLHYDPRLCEKRVMRVMMMRTLTLPLLLSKLPYYCVHIIYQCKMLLHIFCLHTMRKDLLKLYV